MRLASYLTLMQQTTSWLCSKKDEIAAKKLESEGMRLLFLDSFMFLCIIRQDMNISQNATVCYTHLLRRPIMFWIQAPTSLQRRKELDSMSEYVLSSSFTCARISLLWTNYESSLKMCAAGLLHSFRNCRSKMAQAFKNIRSSFTDSCLGNSSVSISSWKSWGRILSPVKWLHLKTVLGLKGQHIA